MSNVTMDHQPKSGRLMVRTLGQQQAAIIGCLELDEEYQEGVIYLAIIKDGMLFITAPQHPLGPPLDQDDDMLSVNERLQKSIWRMTGGQNVFNVRLMKYPADNYFVAYGVSSVSEFTQDHTWMDVVGGHVSNVASPCSAKGNTLDQILQEPVWPVNSHLSTLPYISKNFEDRQHEITMGTILCMKNPSLFSANTMRSFTNTINKINNCFLANHALNNDDFCRFLYEAYKIGLVPSSQVMNVDEHRAREIKVTEAMNTSQEISMSDIASEETPINILLEKYAANDLSQQMAFSLLSYALQNKTPLTSDDKLWSLACFDVSSCILIFNECLKNDDVDGVHRIQKNMNVPINILADLAIKNRSFEVLTDVMQSNDEYKNKVLNDLLRVFMEDDFLYGQWVVDWHHRNIIDDQFTHGFVGLLIKSHQCAWPEKIKHIKTLQANGWSASDFDEVYLPPIQENSFTIAKYISPHPTQEDIHQLLDLGVWSKTKYPQFLEYFSDHITTIIQSYHQSKHLQQELHEHINSASVPASKKKM